MTLFGNKSIKIISNSVLIFSFLSLVVSIIKAISYNGIFKLIWIWPLAFFVFVLLNYNALFTIKKKHFLAMTLIVLLELIPRYVLYPICVLFVGDDYTGIMQIAITNDELSKGTIIGFFELIVFSLFVFLYERTGHREEHINEEPLSLKGNKNVYYVYIFFALCVFAIIGKSLGIVQFLFISTDYNEISTNIYYTLVKYIVSIGLTILILLIINREKKKYIKTQNNIYVYISIAFSIIYVCFIVGESRGTQIAIGLIVMLILLENYPTKRIPIMICMMVSIVVVIISITVFRTGSSETIMGSSTRDFANRLQVYYGGPGSIYQSIKIFEQNVSISISNFSFDFIRSCFPVNLIFKDSGFTTSQIYNLNLYNGMYNHGQIVFGSSFGYIYFSYFGIPIIMCLNYFLASKANEIYYKTRSYEIKYLAGYCMIRLVNAFLSNTPSILGSVTQYIGTFGLLIFISYLLKKNKIKKQE